MINRVVLVGRITKDPELRYTNSNLPFVNFTVAVNRTYANQNGEREADFVQCTIWRKQAENLAKFVSKGKLIGVEGKIQTRTYDDANGVKKYITEVLCDSVQFLEPKSQNQGGYSGQQQSNQNQNNQYNQERQNYNNQKQESTPSIDVSEDDLPF